ncbi:unnamed protein product [Peronospora belbahrii]|uniref:Calcineurin-like phosphoesterase domain-containing protein n=1 Tax=Peronospora belbahrii TaxID=622444 RepID=A0AAU9LBE1_9STRA|nr:unnamed protein product [Peronospora belbahrii]CAH0514415.1 unnamed protein product [Peronospora belbahrii]
MITKKAQLTVVVLILAIIGVIVGVMMTRQASSSASKSSSTAVLDATISDGSSSTANLSGTNTVSKTKKKNNSSSSGSNSITSDPSSAKYTLTAFAIGDWGTTVSQDSCCTRFSTFNDYDVNAEDIVANIMDQQATAASAPPQCIVSHGDNFYWTGINSEESRDLRFTTTFESKYDGPNIKSVPWVNVLGNHDYGGASYICSDGKGLTKCSSADELVKALLNKFSWQADYMSPNDNRWVLKAHFYVYTIKDRTSGVTIDIFNVNAGNASTHGAQQTCCQCYGYGSDKKCKNVARGDKLCAGGDTEMFDACFDKFTESSDDSRKQLAKEVAASTATWKIVNSHYSPYAHYDEVGMKKWFEILQDSGVQLWMNGHTHGENHDYSSSLKVHFVNNGAGGGIQKESASGIPEFATDSVKALWAYGGQEYGFMSVEASDEWLKLQYHTTDDTWVFAENFKSTTIGGVATKHCWYIPLDGSNGKEC